MTCSSHAATGRPLDKLKSKNLRSRVSTKTSAILMTKFLIRLCHLLQNQKNASVKRKLLENSQIHCLSLIVKLRYALMSSMLISSWSVFHAQTTLRESFQPRNTFPKVESTAPRVTPRRMLQEASQRSLWHSLKSQDPQRSSRRLLPVSHQWELPKEESLSASSPQIRSTQDCKIAKFSNLKYEASKRH